MVFPPTPLQYNQYHVVFSPPVQPVHPPLQGHQKHCTTIGGSRLTQSTIMECIAMLIIKVSVLPDVIPLHPIHLKVQEVFAYQFSIAVSIGIHLATNAQCITATFLPIAVFPLSSQCGGYLSRIFSYLMGQPQCAFRAPTTEPASFVLKDGDYANW